MIMCFVVLAILPLSDEVCLDLLKYDDDKIDAVVKFYYGKTASVTLLFWPWPFRYHEYAQSVYATTIICLFGWVSDLLLLYSKILNRQLLNK